jgi:pimeloyl-ACP methyl ester carboxylesterase
MQKKLSIAYKNKSIYYSIFGKGNAVVLVHGFGEDGKVWNEIINGLQKKFLLIVPDLAGSGKSEMLDGDISIEDHADVIKTILDEENITECVMIGHSMGGYITLAFAEKYSAVLKGFGLFHSSAFADDEEKK